MSPTRHTPQRGEVYSIDPDPSLGHEMKGRHYWLVLTDEAVNQYGMVLAVVINTKAAGMREVGLTVQVSAGSVTGVAVLNQVRSFDFRARNGVRGGVTCHGMADPAVVADVAQRLASLIDPDPPEAVEARGKPAASEIGQGALGAALTAAFAKKADQEQASGE